ncbi:MAG: methyltransferase domain-containing protein [Acidimicrobiia bacterium]|jgi:SAM-dependent methyltransferase
MPPVPSGPWFNPIAEHLGRAYWAPDTGRVMAFTKGTEQEVDFVVGALGLEPGQRVLDVGCGPGRHSLALARRGIEVVGVDVSPDFVGLAAAAAAAEALPARFAVLDVRDLAFVDEFDAALCLCQGGFGLLGGRDEVAVFGRIVRAVRPGGGLAVSAFHAPFAIRHLEAGETFDPATGVLHETATVRNEQGEERPFDLWTTCFTARELALLAALNGVVVEGIHGVTPGAYRRTVPNLDDPELLLVGRRP